MEAQQTNCTSCDGEMRPIKLNDATGVIPNRVGVGHVEPTYSAIDAKASWFMGKVPPEGTIKARICTTCGQIVLFGVSNLS
jgi:hypothetical protein